MTIVHTQGLIDAEQLSIPQAVATFLVTIGATDDLPTPQTPERTLVYLTRAIELLHNILEIATDLLGADEIPIDNLRLDAQAVLVAITALQAMRERVAAKLAHPSAATQEAERTTPVPQLPRLAFGEMLED